MKIGDIWKNGGEMEDYQAMSRWANEHGCLFAQNADGDFEIMPMPEPVAPEEVPDPKDVRIAELERRLEKMEAALAALGGGAEWQTD